MEDVDRCSTCGEAIKYYDSVLRVVKRKGGSKEWIPVKRYKCYNCGKIHRQLPDDILPYKQYDADIIRGVLEGYITSETIGYEDYPCEMTMNRWLSQDLQLLR